MSRYLNIYERINDEAERPSSVIRPLTRYLAPNLSLIPIANVVIIRIILFRLQWGTCGIKYTIIESSRPIIESSKANFFSKMIFETLADLRSPCDEPTF